MIIARPHLRPHPNPIKNDVTSFTFLLKIPAVAVYAAETRARIRVGLKSPAADTFLQSGKSFLRSRIAPGLCFLKNCFRNATTGNFTGDIAGENHSNL